MFSGQPLSAFIFNNRLFHHLSLSCLLSCTCFTCGLSLAMFSMEHNEVLSGTYRDCYQVFRDTPL